MEAEMTTLTVQAVYRKGALQPKMKLDLPEDALVQVQVTPVTPTGFAALKGIWSHLSDREVEQAVKDLEKTRRRSAGKIKRLADAISEAGKE
jgi:predicted DNA-binding antitoxin AbrB/MazE fold protein